MVHIDSIIKINVINIRIRHLPTNTYGAIHILYNTWERGGGLTICYIRYMADGGCISYCYITQPYFFHSDPTSWAIHECRENMKNGLLTDADIKLLTC